MSPAYRFPSMTLRQPHASNVFAIDDPSGPKDVENRSSNIVGAYRGPIVIHAGAARDPEMMKLWEDDPAFPRSVLLGVVDVISVHRSRDCSRGPWSPHSPKLCSAWALTGTTHIVLANPRRFPEPMPFADGKLGMWWLPDDVAQEIGDWLARDGG